MGVKITKEKKAEFLVEVHKNHGLIGQTLSQLKISRYYYDLWYNTDPDFAEEVDKIPLKTKEFVESKLIKNINDGDKTSIIFWLKCKGGYIETQHIKQETTFNQPLKINVIAPTPEVKQLPGEEQKKLDE